MSEAAEVIVEETVEEVEPTESVWPDTWRESYAGDDESKLSKLTKYATPAAAFDAMIAAQTKISSGEYKKSSPFPEKGTDEEKSAWRKEVGIPDDGKYDVGREVDEKDQGDIDRFLEYAHGKNFTPDAVKGAVEWFYHDRQALGEAAVEADAQAATECEDSLRADWGEEYRGHMNRIDNLLDTAPEGIKENLLNARFPDGTLLKSNPEMMKFLIDTAVAINPVTTVVPGAGDNIAGALQDELSEIQKLMGNSKSDYWKGPKAEGLQARYKELLEAHERIKK
jgi:hypothetical protein